ncbi:hypothetical protein DPMN_033830 [Dreissena polymorpha]|uniref:Uncharacterized protein n=1 Tax=Dreissena polymorpha TaxID=45954 RepID=A0A9D4M7S0_DREPO|nr:hypothetical protein DPMN_033830 [Dreissena polymorpha]
MVAIKSNCTGVIFPVCHGSNGRFELPITSVLASRIPKDNTERSWIYKDRQLATRRLHGYIRLRSAMDIATSIV